MGPILMPHLKFIVSKRTRRKLRSSKPSLKFIFFKKPAASCFYLLSSRKAREVQEPPSEFRCPISDSLMYDPIIVPTGQTFERACIQACRELNNIHSSFLLQPNDDLKSKILDWCDCVGHRYPQPISEEAARYYAKRCMALHELFQTVCSKSVDDDDGALLESSNCSTTSILESSNNASLSVDHLGMIEKILMNLEVEELSSTTSSNASDLLEVEIVKKLKDAKTSTREEALITLHESVKESRDRRISLCNHRILSAIVPKLHPRHSPIQIIRATSFIISLSSEPSNRIKIVQSGVISRLVSIFKNCDIAACDLAARALSNLALEPRNRVSIGSTPGAISAIVGYFCAPEGNYKGRESAGIALSDLCLSCPDNVVKLTETAGAVKNLFAVAMDRSSIEAMKLGSNAIVVICKLAWISEVREELIDLGAVGEIVRIMMREEAVGYEEHYLAVMYLICDHNRTLFKRLATSSGAEVVLLQDKEGRGEVGMEMVRRMLEVIREDDQESKGEDV